MGGNHRQPGHAVGGTPQDFAERFSVHTILHNAWDLPTAIRRHLPIAWIDCLIWLEKLVCRLEILAPVKFGAGLLGNDNDIDAITLPAVATSIV
jgi:hypothetical protein